MDIQGDVRFSLAVDGEITEAATLPAPGPFDAVVLDDCGTISISYSNHNEQFSLFFSRYFILHLTAFQLIFHRKLFLVLHP